MHPESNVGVGGLARDLWRTRQSAGAQASHPGSDFFALHAHSAPIPVPRRGCEANGASTAAERGDADIDIQAIPDAFGEEAQL